MLDQVSKSYLHETEQLFSVHCSCSTVAYTDLGGREHVRKFCTAAGTSIYNYLLYFPGSALCQNIESRFARC